MAHIPSQPRGQSGLHFLLRKLTHHPRLPSSRWPNRAKKSFKILFMLCNANSPTWNTVINSCSRTDWTVKGSWNDTKTVNWCAYFWIAIYVVLTSLQTEVEKIFVRNLKAEVTRSYCEDLAEKDETICRVWISSPAICRTRVSIRNSLIVE